MSLVHESAHPLVKHKLSLLRDKKTDPIVFRALVGELATLLTYEATADLKVEDIEVHTPLAKTTNKHIQERIGIAPILRAGLGMVEGFLKIIPQAAVLHIGLYRDEKTLQPVEYYNKLKNTSAIERVFVVDPMLATGGSACATIDILKKWGAAQLVFIGLIAAPEGIAELHKHHPDVSVYVAAIDERLTTESDPFPAGYIFPGLGDAGDRQFGT
jgi:uracil phosphoribosyltransferase